MQVSSSTRDENRFKLSTFDDLINPLRNDNPFGKYIDLLEVPYLKSIVKFLKNYNFRVMGSKRNSLI